MHRFCGNWFPLSCCVFQMKCLFFHAEFLLIVLKWRNTPSPPHPKLLKHNSEAANWLPRDGTCPCLLFFEVPTIKISPWFFVCSFFFLLPRLLCSTSRNDVIVFCRCYLLPRWFGLWSCEMTALTITQMESRRSKIQTLIQTVSKSLGQRPKTSIASCYVCPPQHTLPFIVFCHFLAEWFLPSHHAPTEALFHPYRTALMESHASLGSTAKAGRKRKCWQLYRFSCRCQNVRQFKCEIGSFVSKCHVWVLV